MPVETFTREQFEAALPKNKQTGEPMWRALGVHNGEFAYFLPVNKLAGIYIRSSVGAAGVSAESGEDSIRCYLAMPNAQYTPLAKKLNRFTTRKPGWADRLTLILRKLYVIGSHVRQCPDCGNTMSIRVSQSEKNPNRPFYNCGQCNTFKGWAEIPETVLPKAKKTKKETE